MRKLDKRQQVAAKLGQILGPIGAGVQWSPEFVPSWPIDYSTAERRVLLFAADAVIAMLSPSPDNDSAP